MKVFAGYDPREACGYHVFVGSLLHHASCGVSIQALSDVIQNGSNAFTMARFDVPALCEYRGHAIFLDGSDMLMLGDIAELDALFDPRYAVQVVKHPDYTSAHERKYVGTEMECEQSNYWRKNWASAMIVNCEHRAWRPRNPAAWSRLQRLQFQNLLDDEIGEIPPQWNVLIDEGQDDEDAKILHWSSGIPSFRHYRNARRSLDWFAAHDRISFRNHG
jgi:hypothetical protein